MSPKVGHFNSRSPNNHGKKSDTEQTTCEARRKAIYFANFRLNIYLIPPRHIIFNACTFPFIATYNSIVYVYVLTSRSAIILFNVHSYVLAEAEFKLS